MLPERLLCVPFHRARELRVDDHLGERPQAPDQLGQLGDVTGGRKVVAVPVEDVRRSHIDEAGRDAIDVSPQPTELRSYDVERNAGGGELGPGVQQARAVDLKALAVDLEDAHLDRISQPFDARRGPEQIK